MRSQRPRTGLPLAPLALLLATSSLACFACGNDNLRTDDGNGVTPGATGGQAGGEPLPGPGGETPLDASLIDDFEDGDDLLSPLEGRSGKWNVVSDESSPATLTVEADQPAESGFALHVTSEPFSEWGGGTGVNFSSDGETVTAYDGSKYGGIRFRARAASPVLLRFSVVDAYTDQAGGKCTGCWDHFGTDVSLTTEWQEYSIAWADLGQIGFGDARPAVTPLELWGLQFHVAAGEEVDFWLDDVAFAEGGSTGPIIEEPPPREVPEETPVEQHGALSLSGTQIVDEQGDPVQLRGVSSMWLNWENNGFAESLPALEFLRDQWGVSVIRAAMGIEPEGAYLEDPDRARAQVETIVENAVEAGVYVIIDWHDHHAHENQAEAEAFFSEMAAQYAGVPNVLYETFNEPLDLDWSSTLKPYHQAVLGKIREHAPDALVVLGTGQWSQRVDEAAADPVDDDRVLYTLHFYACEHTAWLRNRASDALAAGLPLFVTEWGATPADGGLNGTVCEAQGEQWTNWMRDEGISWAAWKLDGCTDSSCILKIGAPVDGPWTTEWLQGHGYFVRAKVLE